MWPAIEEVAGGKVQRTVVAGCGGQPVAYGDGGRMMLLNDLVAEPVPTERRWEPPDMRKTTAWGCGIKFARAGSDSGRGGGNGQNLRGWWHRGEEDDALRGPAEIFLG